MAIKAKLVNSHTQVEENWVITLKDLHISAIFATASRICPMVDFKVSGFQFFHFSCSDELHA
jgi:hypothetical protein